MRKIIVSEFISLDGVIQAPGSAQEDTEGGFTQGGWTWPYWHDDIGAKFFAAMSACDTLLFGRKTWQIHGGAFEPMVGDAFGDTMNNMPKVVVSTTLTSTAAWRNTTLISRGVIEAVRALKDSPGENILIDGSTVLIHALARADLIDEYSLLVYPVVLGAGKRLFPPGFHQKLKLISTSAIPSGVAHLVYQPARE